MLGTRIAPIHTYHSAIRYELIEEDLRHFDESFTKDRATLARQRHNVSSISDEEALLFENMRIPDTAVPVKVWQELTAERECHDPREFVQEVLYFKELMLAAAEEFVL